MDINQLVEQVKRQLRPDDRRLVHELIQATITVAYQDGLRDARRTVTNQEVKHV